MTHPFIPITDALAKVTDDAVTTAALHEVQSAMQGALGKVNTTLDRVLPKRGGANLWFRGVNPELLIKRHEGADGYVQVLARHSGGRHDFLALQRGKLRHPDPGFSHNNPGRGWNWSDTPIEKNYFDRNFVEILPTIQVRVDKAVLRAITQ